MAVLRYWAGARAAAGVEHERVDAATLAEALDAARAGRDERFSRIVAVCSFVVDEHPVGRTPPAEVVLSGESVVEVLPPFAGGASEPASGMIGLWLPPSLRSRQRRDS